MELAEGSPHADAAAASSLAPTGPPASAGRFDYVTVGHVTVDVIAADGSRRPGGGAFYSALQAARLGLRALIVTQGSPPEIEALLEPYRAELEVHILPAPVTTTFETTWSGTHRSQRLLAWAGPIAEAATVVDTRILHFAPVARETQAAWRGHADFVGLTPQGLVRRWDRRDEGEGRIDLEASRGMQGETGGETRRGMSGETDGDTGGETANETGAEIFPAPLPADRRSLEALLPDGCRAIVISEQERAACAPLLDVAIAQGATVAITAGPGATTVRTPRGETIAGPNAAIDQAPAGEIARVRAHAVASPRDDLGAGDVFAAAFFIALHEGLPPARAAAFGNAAAAVRIEGAGAGAIGVRGAIEARVPGR
jgi:pfkB family carbohydrate kinase